MDIRAESHSIIAGRNKIAMGFAILFMALLLLVNNLLGFVGGTLLVGALSDALAPALGDDSLRYALLAGLVFYLLSAALLFLAARRLRLTDRPG